MLVIFLKVKVSKRVNETWLVWENNTNIVSQLMNSVGETRSIWKFHISLKNKTSHVKLCSEYVNLETG